MTGIFFIININDYPEIVKKGKAADQAFSLRSREENFLRF